MRRSFFQRLQDVAFRIRRERLRRAAREISTTAGTVHDGSVSGSHDWVLMALAAADGIAPPSIRRHPAVFDIVETVGPTDGIQYARLIREWRPELLASPDFRRIDGWGNPVRWPRMLLGTPADTSPTSLRYLATSLWLAREGLTPPGRPVVEIGVGFGGLAACNHLVSDATTTLVDLAPVERLAAKMLRETRALEAPAAHLGAAVPEDFCLVSNYAFTELNSSLQDDYIERWARHAPRGLIVSNAAVFSRGIGGRDDQALLTRLRDSGIPAELTTADPLLAPTDLHHGVTLLHWGRR